MISFSSILVRRPLSIPATFNICVAFKQESDCLFIAATSPTVISSTGIFE